MVEGRIYEVWGIDDVGKTTMAFLAMAEAQKKYLDKQVAYIDMESKYDEAWCASHGVKLDRLYLFEPDDAEDVSDAVRMMVQSGLFSIVVVDSVGAMIPDIEKKKMSDEQVVGTQAKIVTRMVKVNAVECRNSGSILYLINQVRANISLFGADTTTGGGFALKHGTTMKFKMKRTGTPAYKVRRGGKDDFVGHEVAITVERNKVAPPKQTAIVSLFNQATEKYGPLGIDRADEATTLGLDLGIIEQRGSSYTLPDGEQIKSRDRVVAHFREHPDKVEQMRQSIIASIGTQPEDVESASPNGQPVFRRGPQDG